MKTASVDVARGDNGDNTTDDDDDDEDDDHIGAPLPSRCSVEADGSRASTFTSSQVENNHRFYVLLVHRAGIDRMIE